MENRPQRRQRDEIRPRVPAPVGGLARATFRGLSRLRGRRIFHPEGIGFEARLQVPETAGVTAPLLARPGAHRATVRLSRGAGLPDSLPDVLGIAVRVHDADGRGGEQDLLAVSSGRAPLTRHALLPGPAGFFGHFFSTLLPHRIGDELAMVGFSPRPSARSPHQLARIAPLARDAAWDLCLASLTGRWRSVATVRLGERIPDDEADALRFNPWNAAGGIRPAGPLMGIREPAYAGSQEGRRDT